MKIQNINILPFSARTGASKPVLKIGDAIKQKTTPKEDDVVFKKQKGSIMRRAVFLSLIMLSATVAYFRKLG